MAFVALNGFSTSLAAATTSISGILQLDPNAAAQLAAKLGGSGTSYLALSDGTNYEVVKVLSVNSPYINVVRAQDGTTASAFPQGACLRFEWTQEGIAAVASGTPPAIVGTGVVSAAYDSGTNTYTVNVPTPTIDATLPAQVLGAWPAWEVAFQATNGGCCCGSGGSSGGGSPITITGTGLADVTGTDPTFNVAVLSPNFIGINGVTISGSWPNITFSGPGVTPPSGVDSVNAGAKIVLSGSPANVIVNLQNNGSLGAGTYNGVTFDAYGTITAVNSGYIPVTSVTSANGNAVITNPSTGVFEINVGTQTVPAATTSSSGIVQLALPTNAASNNAGDPTSAVTPAGIHAVVAALPAAPQPTFQNTFNYTAASPSAYTITIGATVPLVLAAGQKALVTATASATPDGAAPTFPPAWGLAVFDGATLVQGVQAIVTGTHHMQFVVTGAVASTYQLRTTVLPGSSTVVGYSLTAVILPA